MLNLLEMLRMPVYYLLYHDAKAAVQQHNNAKPILDPALDDRHVVHRSLIQERYLTCYDKFGEWDDGREGSVFRSKPEEVIKVCSPGVP